MNFVGNDGESEPWKSFFLIFVYVICCHKVDVVNGACQADTGECWAYVLAIELFGLQPGAVYIGLLVYIRIQFKLIRN